MFEVFRVSWRAEKAILEEDKLLFVLHLFFIKVCLIAWAIVPLWSTVTVGTSP